MTYLWASAVVVLNLAWVAMNLLTLPGNWLIVATAGVVAWINRDKGMFSPWTIAALIALAAAGEIAELLAGAAGAKRFGGGKRASWGAILGGVAGVIAGTFLIPVPLLGSLLGACIGAAGGAWLAELSSGRQHKLAARAGVGAGVGRFAGLMVKLAIGIIMAVIADVAAFWP